MQPPPTPQKPHSEIQPVSLIGQTLSTATQIHTFLVDKREVIPVHGIVAKIKMNRVLNIYSEVGQDV